MLKKFASLMTLLLPAISTYAQAIWFSPNAGPSDYMALFQPDAPWQQVSTHIQTFCFSCNQVFNPSWGINLPDMLSDLRRRHISLEVGMSPLSGDGHCGFHVEGYSNAAQPLSDARRLKAAGAEVSCYAMDEPFYYGHVFTGQNACHASIEDIAKDVAAKVKQVRSIYPGVGIGDVEPVGIPYGNWLSDLEQWFDAFNAATGSPLAFFRVDMQWGANWQGQMRQLAALLRRKGIPLQVIYNGSGNDRSDAAWTAQAAKHFRDYEASGLPKPDVAVFQCWTKNPTRMLPETDPSTLTGLVLQYIKSR
ncbi:hypothetical protein [Dinghuibacter silviterrae]|uniref:Uncharacterized protein n=1 Tax=Dinghuibacter silviterrae TaxID=1539049 RepID=A0A4R8DW08_9BACT|nr:hypothetical protein [Dinghuibacter silviterrae]TDX02118.1 hypothetical protein EDB95_3168 [Dinghuibacter silviterrae]